MCILQRVRYKRAIWQLWITGRNGFYFTTWKLLSGRLLREPCKDIKWQKKRWFWFEFELLEFAWTQQLQTTQINDQIFPALYNFYVRILAGIITVTFVFHFKGHYNTMPKVIWQCPCHFLWPHLDFLSVCSSCHPMLILPFPAQMFPLKLCAARQCFSPAALIKSFFFFFFYLLPSETPRRSEH